MEFYQTGCRRTRIGDFAEFGIKLAITSVMGLGGALYVHSPYAPPIVVPGTGV